jgi:undecaprenyl-diphosphatase
MDLPRYIRKFPRLEAGALAILIVLAGGIWVFVSLADLVSAGATERFDQAVLLAMRSTSDPSNPVGPAWIEEAVRDFTALGSLGVLLLITVLTVLYLVLRGDQRAAAFVIVAILGAWSLSSLLKMGFDRPRPDLVPHITRVSSASFPSGHAMTAAATYLTLGALLARLERRFRVKLFLVGSAMLITLIVGVSRVYLGVHWPTDVLAGWAAGAAWASLCWLAAYFLQWRGQLEPEGETT